MMTELKQFMRGINHESGLTQDEMTKSALNLLSYMPAARSAVLEYFTNLLYDKANNYTMCISEGKSVGWSIQFI